jgi:hypothetical protein
VVAVRVEVDSGGVLFASTHLVTRGSLVEGQVAVCAAIADGLRDPSLAAGAGDLTDVATDVLVLVAMDLGLLAGRVRSGAVLYERVEERVRDGMTAP